MPRPETEPKLPNCPHHFGPITVLQRPVYKFGWYKVFGIIASKL